MTFEEKMAQAFKETFDERSERLMKVEKKHRFSLAYRLWERKTIRDLRRNRRDEHWTLKRARYIVAAMTVACSLLIGGTTYASVALIGRFGFEDNNEYSRMFIENRPSDKTSFEEYYGLPEEDGWEITDRYIYDTEIYVVYRKGEKSVLFGQRIITEGTIENIYTEKNDPEPVSLYEKNDGFIIVDYEDWCLLYWLYDGYVFDLGGDVTKNEAINLALSAEIVEF